MSIRMEKEGKTETQMRDEEGFGNVQQAQPPAQPVSSPIATAPGAPAGGGSKTLSRSSSLAWAPSVPPSEKDDHASNPTNGNGREPAHHHSHHQPQLSRRTTERTNNRSTAKKGDQPSSPPEKKGKDKEKEELSLADRLASSAWSATVDILKLAGELTLSTTGKLVAPPLLVTRMFLLPAVFSSLMELLNNQTPERIKDWFRIASTSVYHFVMVLKDTDSGKHFRGRFLLAWFDFVDLLTADVTRQALLDGTATVVKFAKLLNTDECHEWLQQVAIWSCRVLAMASHGRNQQLIHDIAAACKSATQVWADPHTTLALAEVTAYLCYALEMEQQHQLQHSPKTAKFNQQRRQDRNQYQTATYLDRLSLLQDPSATVEQVILSSLGIPLTNATGTTAAATTAATTTRENTTTGGSVAGGSVTRGGTGADVESIGRSVPSRIVVCEPASSSIKAVDVAEDVPRAGGGSVAGAATSADWDQDSTIRNQPTTEHQTYDDGGSVGSSASSTRSKKQTQQPNPHWTERALKDIDVEYLRRQIHGAAAATAAGKLADPIATDQSTMDGSSVAMLDDLEDLVGTQSTSNGDRGSVNNKRPRVQVVDETDANDNINNKATTESDEPKVDWSSIANPMPLEGETSIHHFYRILDEIMDQKREKALQDHFESAAAAKKGTVRKPVLEEQDLFSKTIKQRLAESNKSMEGAAFYEDQSKSIGTLGRRKKLYIFASLAMLCWFMLFWFALGCYGLYALVLAPATKYAPSNNGPMIDFATTTSSRQPQEFVVRIIREVVHVDAAGNKFESPTSDDNDGPATAEDMAKISQCIVDAVSDHASSLVDNIARKVKK